MCSSVSYSRYCRSSELCVLRPTRGSAPNFIAEDWIRLAREHAVTTAFVVPTMLARIVETLEGESSADMPHLKSLSYGGGKMPLSVIEKAMTLFPDTNFTNAYGLTETS